MANHKPKTVDVTRHKHDDFDNAWNLFRRNKEFKEYCKERDLTEEVQKYLVITGMDHRLNDGEKCEIIGMKYNFRPHQKVKEDCKDDTHDRVLFLITKTLTVDVKREESDKKPKIMTDIERLQSIISGDFRVSDQLKAMELKEKLTKIHQGSQVLKPWERIWCHTIIPNMLQGQDLQ